MMNNCSSASNNQTNRIAEGIFCDAVWDNVMCWPATKANTTLRQPCPPIKGHDPKKFIDRFCSPEGTWIIRKTTAGDVSLTDDWSNYTDCFTEEVLSFLKKLFSGEVERKIRIAENTRTLELIGLFTSVIFLVASITVFRKFRGLRNNRTKIHLNLFLAMLVQVIVRLVLYLDQAILKHYSSFYNISTLSGIDTTPILCECAYSLLEYAKTVMFMWMFMEGLYLHNNVAGDVFEGRFNYKAYVTIGWGLPVLITFVWIIVMVYTAQGRICWYGYNFMWSFWIIMEIPRAVMLVVNFLFLLNIVRVLVEKLRQSATPEMYKIRKAVRAAVFLLPLLGLPNMLFLIEAPIDDSAHMFALWSYSAYFFSSFQGVMVSVLYCFLNGEIRKLLMNRSRFHINFWYDRYVRSKRIPSPSIESELSNN